ncbi:MAG: hypothetical protein U0Y68_17110 [Blastocatellia bacterium]
MNRKALTILTALVLLTFAGLVLVSNLISKKKPPELNAAAALLPASPHATPLPSARPAANAATIATDLHFAQAQLDSLSDAINEEDWEEAQTRFAAFELKDRRLPSPQLRHPDISPLLQDFFDLYVVQLDRAISEKQPKDAHLAINQLLGIITETKTRFIKRATPAEVQRLHQLVRDLSFWQALGDEKMTRVRAAALREAWNDVSPLIRARKQGEAVAQQFDVLLSQTAAAESPSQLTPLLPELTNNLEQMDSLFQSSGGRGESGNQDEN